MKEFLHFLLLNIGKIIGIISAFIISLLIVIFGIAKTLIILLFCLLGYIIGKWFDEGISPLTFLSEAIKSLKEGKWR